MKGRPWLGLGGSVALHAGVVALALVLLRSEEPLPALIIDLREPLVAGSASARPPEEEKRPAPSSRAPRSTREKTEVAAPAPQPTPAAPSAPPAPASEPVPAPPPAPVVEAPPAPAPAPAPVVQAPPVLPRAPTSEPGVAGGSGASTSGTGSASARGASGGDVSGGSASGGATGLAPSGLNSGAEGSREGSGPTGPVVAAVPPGGGGAVGSGAGSGAGGAAEYGPYLTALRQRIQQSLHYPASARRRGVAGTVNVEILILPDGTIGGVTLLESSSHTVLDEGALDTIRSLPRMPLPRDLPTRPLRVRVPVVFEMR